MYHDFDYRICRMWNSNKNKIKDFSIKSRRRCYKEYTSKLYGNKFISKYHRCRCSFCEENRSKILKYKILEKNMI